MGAMIWEADGGNLQNESAIAWGKKGGGKGTRCVDRCMEVKEGPKKSQEVLKEITKFPKMK